MNPTQAHFNTSRPVLAAAVLGLLTLFGSSAAVSDFKVEAPDGGHVFKLSDAKGNYVALHFLLKTECPYCLRYTRTFAQQAATLPDVVQVFLKPDTAEEIKEWAASLGAAAGQKLTIYRDPEAKLAQEYGVPDGYKFHGQVVHFPALILLDPTGAEVFRYVGKDNSDRYSFDLLKAKVAELKAQAAKK